MTVIYDQTGDANFRQLHRYLRLYGEHFPEFAKKADLSEVVTTEGKAQLFADVRQPHQLPCHNKSATIVSHIFWLEGRDKVASVLHSLIEQRLAKFAEYWGIAGEVAAIREKHASLHDDLDSKLPDSAYAIVWATDGGRKERRYPLRNADEVKAAAEWFHDRLGEIRQQFDFTDRQTIASKILGRAELFGAETGDFTDTLEKSAGRGVANPKKVATALRNRATAGSRVSEEVGNGMRKLAEMVESRSRMCVDRGTMLQFAQTVDTFDRAHGLLNKYSEYVPSPEDVIFETTRTKLSELRDSACRTNTGAIYDKADFSKLSVSDVHDIFGDEMTKAVVSGHRVDPDKMAEIAATLPLGDADLLDQLMAEANVRPLAKEAGTGIGFSRLELESMAATT